MPPIRYSHGKVTVLKNSRIITGHNTYWLRSVHEGDFFVPQRYTTTGVVDDVGFYEIEKVVSDTEILLRDLYLGESLEKANYYIERYPVRQTTVEEAKRQMFILDRITDLDSYVDSAKDSADRAEIALNQTEIYMNRSEAAMEKAIEMAYLASASATLATQQAEIATEQAEISTEQAEISTDKAEVSTDKAEHATTQANRAQKIVDDFLANANSPGGVPVVGADGKILADLIPGTFKDIQSYPTFDDFPAVGSTGFFYVALDSMKTYLWGGGNINVYVPVDTTLALAGNGESEAAARADHNHDFIYQPYSDDAIDEVLGADIDLDTTYIRPGSYILTPFKIIELRNSQSNQQEEIAISRLEVKRVDGAGITNDNMVAYIQVAYLSLFSIPVSRLVIYEKLDGGTHVFHSSLDWDLLIAQDTLAMDGKNYRFLTQNEYNELDGGIKENSVCFIETGTSGQFPILSINGIYPSGNGNVVIDTVLNTENADPETHPLFGDANQIRLDNKAVLVSVENYGTVENYPNIKTAAPVMFLVNCYTVRNMTIQICYTLDVLGVWHSHIRSGVGLTWGAWQKTDGSGNGASTGGALTREVIGAVANQVEILPVSYDDNIPNRNIEVLKFSERNGLETQIGAELNIANKNDFEADDDVEFTLNGVTLNSQKTLVNNTVTPTNEFVIDVDSLNEQFADWMIIR